MNARPKRPLEYAWKPRKKPAQHELREQKELAEWLDRTGVLWEHIPLGGARNAITGAMLKACGVKKGSLDNRIYTPPPGMHGVTGVAVELKRADGEGRTSPEQLRWKESLERLQWRVLIADGAAEAIKALQGLGYYIGMIPRKREAM